MPYCAEKTDGKDRITGVRRFDAVARLDSPALLPNGWLEATAWISRTGIQAYHKADGSTIRELRPQEEVFHVDSLASLRLNPIVDDHPPVGLLTAENTREYQRGHLGDTITHDDSRVQAKVLVTDGKLIEKILAGKQQLSCGYTCDLEMTEGEFEGEKYDAIQRSIRGNHVAVVDVARGGPELRLNLDGADIALIPYKYPEEIKPPATLRGQMEKIKIDGVEYEASEQVVQAFENFVKKTDATVAEMAESVSKIQARCDVAEGKVTELEQGKKDAEDPEKLSALVAARVALEQKGLEILGKDAKFDGQSDAEIRSAILAKIAPAVKLDGKDETYISTAYEVALASLDERTLEAARVLLPGGQKEDAADPREEMIKRNREMWKNPAGAKAQA